MSKLRIIYVLSLVILGVLATLAVFRPLVVGKEYSSVARESVLQDQRQWIIQFDIINREARDMNYDIVWTSGGVTYREKVLVARDRIYTHIRHIYLEQIREGKVNLTVYKEGDETPFEQVTYHLE